MLELLAMLQRDCQAEVCSVSPLSEESSAHDSPLWNSRLSIASHPCDSIANCVSGPFSFRLALMTDQPSFWAVAFSGHARDGYETCLVGCLCAFPPKRNLSP